MIVDLVLTLTETPEGVYTPMRAKAEKLRALLDAKQEPSFVETARRAWQLVHELECYSGSMGGVYLRNDLFSTIVEKVLRMEYPGITIYRNINGRWVKVDDLSASALLYIREGFEDHSGWSRPGHYPVRGSWDDVPYKRSVSAYYQWR